MHASPQPVIVHRGPNRNFSAGGFAARHGLRVVAFVDDARARRLGVDDEIPVLTFAEWRDRFRAIPNLVSALAPAFRRDLAERIGAAGGTFAPMRGRDGNAVSEYVTFGDGTLTGDGPLFIGCNTTIGRHVIIMTPISLGHDVIVGDFVTIHPSAAISGYVVIEDDVEIGAGAVIVNGNSRKALRIGRAARIDTGAVVTKPVRAGMVVTGNPARAAGLAQAGI